MKKNAAFTLLEILIALTVFAILATITSSAMYYAFNTRSRVTVQAERLMTLQLALTLIERDIQQVANRAVHDSEVRLLPAFIGRNNYMELTRGGLTNPNSSDKRSTLKRIALLCDKQQLIRRSWPVLDTLKRKEYDDKVLLQQVVGCQLAYLNDQLQVLPEWRANAMPAGRKTSSLPKAVQLTLTLSDWGKASFLFILPEGLYAET
ncbi:type II secretory pathway protein LspJ [Legionella rubrilucens]|uniref:Type II secretion system protein J n=1 Tax=Legionella rubrilucens TaxID=458 RepID=A0A0W0Y5X9_9GAMM|nr:GspJ family T2SS minor pseudopilin variant LspJ [Legionella rubrilucens]KTD52380.1 type II secretory pathway protein LspJ [Legionella rubrilucens]